MALSSCPDCNGNVSDQAPTCPHCGRPLTREDRDVPFPSPAKSVSGSGGCAACGWLSLGIVGALLLGLGGCFLLGVVASANQADSLAEASPEHPFVMYVQRNANVRSRPSTDSAIVRTEKRGSRVKATGVSGDWIRLEDEPVGTKCWMAARLLDSKRPKKVNDAPSRHSNASETGQLLNASVRVHEGAIELTNLEDKPWRSCTVEINPAFFSGGYKHPPVRVPNYETVRLPLMSFTDGDHNRFNILRTSLDDVSVFCETETGHRYYAGSFR